MSISFLWYCHDRFFWLCAMCVPQTLAPFRERCQGPLITSFVVGERPLQGASEATHIFDGRWRAYYIYLTHTYGCGSKCKVWIKSRSHKRSRPLIQTPDPDLSKGVDPDLWSRPLEWYYLWASWCLQLFNLPSSQATNCFKATVPSCQTSKLHLLQSHAAKQSSCQAATTLSSCQTATFLKQPSCLAAKLTLLQGRAAKQPRCPLAAFTLLSFSCHTASKLQYTQKSGFNSRPRPIQTRIQTDPDHNQLRVSPCKNLWLFGFLPCFKLLWFTIHEIWNFCSRSLRLSMWPLVKPHFMSYHLAAWRPLDHAPLRNSLVPDVRISAGRSRGFLEPYPYNHIII